MPFDRYDWFGSCLVEETKRGEYFAHTASGQETALPLGQTACCALLHQFLRISSSQDKPNVPRLDIALNLLCDVGSSLSSVHWSIT